MTKDKNVGYNTNSTKEITTIYKIVGDNVARLRGRMRKQDLADKAGISRQTLSKIEDGQPFALGPLIKVANALGVELHELFIPTEKISETIYSKRIRLMDEILKDRDLFTEFIERVIENTYDVKRKKSGGGAKKQLGAAGDPTY